MNPSTDDFVKGFDSVMLIISLFLTTYRHGNKTSQYYKNANVVVIESKSIALIFSLNFT